MAELRRADLAALVELAASLRTIEDSERFGEAVLGPLRQLVPADSITYNEIDTRHRRTIWAVDPPDSLDDTDPAAFVRYVSQHPIVAYSRRTGDGRAHTISDFLDRREFHRTDLYSTFLRPARAEYQIAITLSYAPGYIVGIALNRTAHDFTNRDRAVLNLARTQLVACAQAVATAEQTAALLGAMDRALDDQHRGVLIVRPDGRLITASPTAHRLLGTHLGVRPGADQHLPARLAALADGAPTRCTPVLLRGQGARLYASLLPSAERDQRIIVIDERPLGDLPPLSAAGLTVREHQILALVATGRSNLDIARQLVLSIRTVHKHLEHLYPKLGVHDRTSAATRWLSEQRIGNVTEH
jgi:DNA-binding CsgD family transcriptional regulator